MEEFVCFDWWRGNRLDNETIRVDCTGFLLLPTNTFFGILKAYLVTREEWIDKGVDVVGHLASKQSLLEEAAADKSRAPMVIDNRQ